MDLPFSSPVSDQDKNRRLGSIRSIVDYGIADMTEYSCTCDIGFTGSFCEEVRARTRALNSERDRELVELFVIAEAGVLERRLRHFEQRVWMHQRIHWRYLQSMRAYR